MHGRKATKGSSGIEIGVHQFLVSVFHRGISCHGDTRPDPVSHPCLHLTKNLGTARPYIFTLPFPCPALLAPYNRKLTKLSSHVREVGSKHRAPLRSRIEQILDQNMIEEGLRRVAHKDHRGTRLLGELPWRTKEKRRILVWVLREDRLESQFEKSQEEDVYIYVCHIEATEILDFDLLCHPFEIRTKT